VCAELEAVVVDQYAGAGEDEVEPVFIRRKNCIVDSTLNHPFDVVYIDVGGVWIVCVVGDRRSNQGPYGRGKVIELRGDSPIGRVAEIGKEVLKYVDG